MWYDPKDEDRWTGVREIPDAIPRSKLTVVKEFLAGTVGCVLVGVTLLLGAVLALLAVALLMVVLRAVNWAVHAVQQQQTCEHVVVNGKYYSRNCD